jgi:SAM-dependent methyltransferase
VRKQVRESLLAHRLLDGLKGLEIGGSAGSPWGLDILNVDFSDSMDTIYKRAELEGFGEALPVDIIASGDDLPLPDESQGFVVSSHVLEHMPDPIKALAEWCRVIRPGGYILMIVPHRDRIFDKPRPRTPLAEVIRRHATGNYPRADDHHSVWITEDIVELVHYLGLGIVAVQDRDDKVGNGFAVVVQKERAGHLPWPPISDGMLRPSLHQLLEPLSPPAIPARALWGDEVELLGFDITSTGEEDYEIATTYVCLRSLFADYVQGLHLVPTNTAVLREGVPRAAPAMGALVWDAFPAPPTSTWEPGRRYRVATYGHVPTGGGVWSIKVGLYQVNNGKVVEIKMRSDREGRGQAVYTSGPIPL